MIAIPCTVCSHRSGSGEAEERRERQPDREREEIACPADS